MAIEWLISLGIPIGGILYFVWYFQKRIKIDDKRYNKPLNLSLNQIYENNFKDEGYSAPPKHRFVVVPKNGLNRKAHNIGSMFLESLPKYPEKFSEFETIVVNDVNNSNEIKKSIIDKIRSRFIPIEILSNLPINWREYLTWKLLKENPPKGYGHLIIEMEKFLELTDKEKEAFEIITDSKKMFSYLEITFLEETRKEFDFLKRCIYKMCRAGVPKNEFDWILKEISKKKLIIVQVLSDLKKDIYTKINTNIIKQNKSSLSYNMVDVSYQLMHDIKIILDTKKLKNRIYSSSEIPFATLLIG